MRRGLAKLAQPPSASAAFSTFSGAGGSAGSGRGRGRGDPPPPVLGQPAASSDEDPFISAAGRGRGRGGGAGTDAPQPSSPLLPSFPSFLPSAGRGRGTGTISPTQNAKKPIFFSRDETLPPPGSGRGKPTPADVSTPAPISPAPQPEHENRHLKKREEAQKKALETLSRGPTTAAAAGRGAGGPARGGMRGGGRGMRGGRGGRGRGRFGGRGSMEEKEEDLTMYLGDNASGERLEKKLGEEKMKVLESAFEEAAARNLPSPVEDAYLDALHTNNMIEYEPEYMVNFENPDVDEKPPMSLEEALETAKPFLVAYEGIQSQEEWEEAVKDVMGRLPHMQNLIDIYCGPDRVTAKEQQHELRRVADTIPQNVPGSVKRFTDKVLLSLQSNPGWGYDKKYIFMDKLAREINQQYK
ncbi:hypothetical protein LUZ60_017279 [Juncus effusus]|nr:hypothetical protein LUZ60_017279 [Juncus effusus]